jgi:hypothetical protein
MPSGMLTKHSPRRRERVRRVTALSAALMAVATASLGLVACQKSSQAPSTRASEQRGKLAPGSARVDDAVSRGAPAEPRTVAPAECPVEGVSPPAGSLRFEWERDSVARERGRVTDLSAISGGVLVAGSSHLQAGACAFRGLEKNCGGLRLTETFLRRRSLRGFRRVVGRCGLGLSRPSGTCSRAGTLRSGA